MTLEEQFAQLVAGVAARPMTNPDLLCAPPLPPRTRTVYSVGEAMNQKRGSAGAKLGSGSIRDSGSGR